MKSILAASAASLALVAGTFVGAATAPATAVVRDDGANHARHTQRDDGVRKHRVAKAKRDDGPRHVRHTRRDDRRRAKRDDGPHRARHTRRDDGTRAKRDDGPHPAGRRHG